MEAGGWRCSSCSHSIDLVEGFPLLILDSQGLCGLDGPLHVARPHLQVADALPSHVLAQRSGKLMGTQTDAAFVKAHAIKMGQINYFHVCRLFLLHVCRQTETKVPLITLLYVFTSTFSFVLLNY